MDTEQINILLARHFAGETTKEQEQVLEKWIADHRDEYVALKILWADTHEVSSPQLFPVDRAWEKTMQQIRPAVVGKGRGWGEKSNYWIAAAAVVLVMVSGLLYYFNSSVTVNTMANEIKKVPLNDGTIVTLNGSSGITYPRYFSANREVALTGEAYFEVKRDVKHPFRVKSNRLLVQVLGTAFLVKNSGNVQHVLVNSGKVAVKDEQSGQSTVLTANQAVAVSNGTILKEPANENDLAWKSGILNFKDVPLKQVFTALEDYYHISIVVDNGYEGSCLLTSQFDRQPPGKVFEELSRIFGFTYKISGKKVTVSGITCEKQ